MKWGYLDLYCPFEQWYDLEVQKTFCEIVALKKLGYDNNYSNSLPVDQYDLVSDHHLVWVEVDGQKKIVATMKSIDCATLQKYKLYSPCEVLINTIKQVADVRPYQFFIDNLREQYKSHLEKIRFFNGWTIDPSFRGKSDFQKMIKQAVVATIPFTQEECGSYIGMGNGMPHLHTDKVFYHMGYGSWTDPEGNELPGLPSPGYDMRETVFMVGTDISAEYRQEIAPLRFAWNGRTIIGQHRGKTTKKEAA